jgi:ubiquinone/menaquinone biosynthesis C-methylase UbiE
VSREIDDRKLANWYNFQARFYHLWRDDYHSPLIEIVAERLAARDAPATILDAGCGTGMFAVGLARARPAWSVEGLDAAAGMLAVARRQTSRLGLANASFRRGDAAALPFADASRDGIVAAGLFPNLNDWAGPLAEFHRVLRPDGRLVVVELDRESMSAAVRAFFRVMIFGYRFVSTLVPRFRFTRRWNVEASTVDRALLVAGARAAGFAAGEPARHGSHLVLEFVKGAR